MDGCSTLSTHSTFTLPESAAYFFTKVLILVSTESCSAITFKSTFLSSFFSIFVDTLLISYRLLLLISIFLTFSGSCPATRLITIAIAITITASPTL